MSRIAHDVMVYGTLKTVAPSYCKQPWAHSNWAQDCWREFTELSEEEKQSFEKFLKFSSLCKQLEQLKARKKNLLNQEFYSEKELKNLDSLIVKISKSINELLKPNDSIKIAKPKRGRTGNVVICNETKETWESATACAKHFGTTLCNVVWAIKNNQRLLRKWTLQYVA